MLCADDLKNAQSEISDNERNSAGGIAQPYISIQMSTMIYFDKQFKSQLIPKSPQISLQYLTRLSVVEQ